MALARCEKCGAPKGRSSKVYSGKARLPNCHPQSGVICGNIGCNEPALIWLLESEQTQYQKGLAFLSKWAVFVMPNSQCNEHSHGQLNSSETAYVG